MTLNLDLPADTVARIRQMAAARQQDVDSFVAQALAEKLAEDGGQLAAADRDERQWVEKLRDCSRLHPVARHFVDDSRESIYAGRGQ